MIAFTCPGCQHALTVADEFAGRNCRCPHCGGIAPAIPRAIPLETAAPAAPPGPVAVQPGRPLSETRAWETGGPFSPGLLDGLSIPGYEIVCELGRGGMGVVYKARQTKLKRLVALKMILAGAHAGPELLARFRAEAEAVARLQHPNIVQIYEVGEHDHLPYCTLEFVDGPNLAHQLAGNPLPAREAAQLLETLARATHAAHERGIVHRDLKPSNILLQPKSTTDNTDTKRLAGSLSVASVLSVVACVPKITDFGLAKQLGAEAGQTNTGAVVGTPSYMAPEQALGKKEVGPAADVYALGAILYELLTGRPPFKGATAMDTVMQVVTDEPVPPSRLQSKVPLDLETICLKCLEKDARKRYASALALAQDLRRFLNYEPIQARPIGAGGRLWRWCRRNPRVAALMTAVAVALLAGSGFSSYFAIQAHVREKDALRERDRADRKAGEAAEQKTRADKKAAEAEASATQAKEERLRADRRSYLADMRLAQRAWEEAQVGTLQGLLEANRPERTGGVDLRSFEWYYWHHLCQAELLSFKEHRAPVHGVAYSPDGKRLASAGGDGTVKVWDAATGQVALTLKGHDGPVHAVAFTSNGQRLASAGEDKTVRIWDAGSGKELFTLKGHSGPVLCVAFRPDGWQLASGSADHTIKVWDSSRGQERLTCKGNRSPINCVAFSPDGKLLASASGYKERGTTADRVVKLWDAATGELKHTFPLHLSMPFYSVAFSPDGKRLAGGGYQEVKFYDLDSLKEVLHLVGHTGYVVGVGFTERGDRLATASWDQTVRVWDAGTGREVLTFKGHTGPARAVAFRRDGQRLASASEDQTVKVWNLAPKLDTQTIQPSKGHQVLALAVSPDGKCWASGGTATLVRVQDVIGGREVHVGRGESGAVWTVAFSPEGQRVAFGRGKTVMIWDLSRDRLLHALEGHGSDVVGLAFTPNGKLVASASHDQTVKLWDSTSGRVVHTLKGHLGKVFGVAVSPDGKRLASGSLDRTVKLWDVATGREQATLRGHGGTVNAVAFSPDGKWLASGSEDFTIKLWDTTDWQEVQTLRGHASMVYALGFHPDGRRLASAGQDGLVTVWDVASGRVTLTLKAHRKCVHGVVFSPVGHRLFSGSCDGDLKIWDASQPEEKAVSR